MELWNHEGARVRVVEACLELAELGYLAGIGGNYALRTRDRCFAVTPSAADYYTLRPQDVCILHLDTLEVVAGEMQPSVESGMHAALFRRRPDLHASVHTHQPVASAVALLNREISVQGDEARAQLGPVVQLTAYAPSGTGFLVRAFNKVLRDDVNAYLLRNHGIIAGGPTQEQAIRNVQLIEQEAARFLREKIQARSTPVLPAAVMETVLNAV